MSATSIGLLAILVILFFVGRDITLWYFRINFREDQLVKIIKLLTEIRDNQKKSNGIFISEEK
jgi:hypothetical protein